MLEAHVCADPKARGGGGKEPSRGGGEGFWVARGGRDHLARTLG